jgi:hypothetical protein
MLCNSRYRLAIALVICAAHVGCSKKPKATESAPSASATNSSAPSSPARCTSPNASALYVIGEAGPVTKPDAGDEDGGVDLPGLPFAVEVGRAIAVGDGFAVGALSTKKGATRAQVAVVDGKSLQGKLLDLGSVKGDVDPPELASFGDRLMALVHDNDANGALLRLAKLGARSTEVTWGTQVPEGRDESHVADIEIGKERGAVVWDAYDKAHKHSQVHVYTFGLDDPSNTTRPRVLSIEGRDAEAPRVVRRPGGVWVAWVEHAVDPRATKPKPLPAPRASSSAGEPVDEPLVVDLGQRTLTVQVLDENATPSGPIVDVSGAKSHVVVFDMVPAPDGGLFVAWRDDDRAPGGEGNGVKLARVRADGTAEQHAVDETLGVGAPLLLVDESPKDPRDRVWLSLESISDASRIASVGDRSELVDMLDTDPLFQNGDPLAVSKGRMLIARPKGLAIELGVLECRRGPPPPAPAAPSASAP